LFPSRDPFLPITARQFNRACHMAAEVAGLGTWISPHTLRHNAESRIMPSDLSMMLARVMFGQGHSA
jgi:integrase